MGWILLFIGIFTETAGSTCMKLSCGFTKLYPSTFVFMFYGISFSVFIFALKYFDLSFAYAIWAGLGIMLISVIGMLFFNESVNWLKIVSIFIIVIGVVTLNISEMIIKAPPQEKVAGKTYLPLSLK
jgi:small multidrug resistance pump